MKYRYAHALPNVNPATTRQVALLKTSLQHQGNEVQVRALIDSGADISVFNMGYADLLGIDPKECEAVTVGGVGGVPYDCYKTTIKVQPEGLAAITVPVLFIDSSGVDGILGQEGFFDQHVIRFDKAETLFEVTPK